MSHAFSQDYSTIYCEYLVRKNPFLENLTIYSKNFIINLSGFRNGGKIIGFSKTLSIGSTDHLITTLKTEFGWSRVGPGISATLCEPENLWKQYELNSKFLSGHHNSLDTTLCAPVRLSTSAQLF